MKAANTTTGTKTATRLTVLALAMVLVVGCGWQLRGSTALSDVMDSLHLTGSDRYTPLMTTLRQRIDAADIQLAETTAGADYTLAITDETLDRRVASVGADALASAYELTLTARFDVLDASGQPLARGLTSRVHRSFNASGGDSQEQALVTEELRGALARQLLRRLQAVIKAAPEPEPTDEEPPRGETDS